MTINRIVERVRFLLSGKKAEWIVEGCRCMEIGICSHCGIGMDEFRKFKYCPNCGAKMEVRNGG